MIFKRFIMLVAIASLGACSSMPSILPDATSGNGLSTQAEADNAAQEALADADNTSENAQEKTAEQLIAIELNTESDLYELSKRTLSPANKSKVLAILAQFKQGENEASLQAINALLANTLDLSSTVYVLAGDIAAANQLREQAAQHYQNALRVNEYNAKAANRLAMMARAQGDFEKAELLYSQAINARPAAPEAYRNRAVLYDLYLNQKEKALNDYQAYSALLEHRLEHDSNYTQLSEAQTKMLKKEIKLGKRWLIDVGRQVTALARANSNSQAGGK